MRKGIRVGARDFFYFAFKFIWQTFCINHYTIK